MASKSLFGEGKNAVQHTEHVRSVKYPNGNQGFSSGANRMGGDTIPGPMRGAPMSSKVEQTTSSKQVDKTGMNPFNKIEANAAGVIGGSVKTQNAGRYPDSPVPSGAQIPNINRMTKASEVAAASEAGNTPHPEGVLGRG